MNGRTGAGCVPEPPASDRGRPGCAGAKWEPVEEDAGAAVETLLCEDQLCSGGGAGDSCSRHCELAAAVDRAVQAAVEAAMTRVAELVEKRCAALQVRIETREKELQSLGLRLGLTESGLSALRDGMSSPRSNPDRAGCRQTRGLDVGCPAADGHDRAPPRVSQSQTDSGHSAGQSSLAAGTALSTGQGLYGVRHYESAEEEPERNERSTFKCPDEKHVQRENVPDRGLFRSGEPGHPLPSESWGPCRAVRDVCRQNSNAGLEHGPVKEEASELGFVNAVEVPPQPPDPLKREVEKGAAVERTGAHTDFERVYISKGRLLDDGDTMASGSSLSRPEHHRRGGKFQGNGRDRSQNQTKPNQAKKQCQNGG